MTRARRTWMIAGAVVLIVVAGWTLAIGAVVAMGGVMTVELLDRDGGVDVYLPLPMAVLDLALLSVDTPAIAVAGVGHVHMDDLDVDLGAIGPVLLDVLDELDRLPDVTLVEVQEGRDRVRIAKRGDKLRIEIDDRGTSLSLSVPTRGALRIADRLLG